MPDSDMDSVAHTMEGSGPFDPTVLATTPKKRKAKKKRNLIREGSVSPTLGQTHHRITVNQVLPLTSIQPIFPEEDDNDANASTDQVVVAVPVVTQTSFQKKKGLFGRSLLTLTCPTSLLMTTITRTNS